jgi:hypothetical protein
LRYTYSIGQLKERVRNSFNRSPNYNEEVLFFVFIILYRKKVWLA